MLEKITTIHCIGIGGIGMSAIAKLLLAEGKTVSGSDLALSEITADLERRGITVFDEQKPEHISQETDLVIYSSAVPETNPERKHAAELGIPELSYPEYLAELSKHYSTIVVTGTNGKSTTTAMLGLLLEAAGYDPTVLVGSLVPGWELGNLRMGKGRFFVVEGCEYREHMTLLHPEAVVLTNIEEDHLDYYKDIDHIRGAFQKLVDKLKGKGMVIVNADDKESMKLSIDTAVSYAASAEADYQLSQRRNKDGKQQFSVSRKNPEEKLGVLELGMPGAYNAMNALAATTAAMELGVTFELCQKTLKRFTGIWRRFERVGEINGATVISDYGHHPTAVSAALKAAREFFPDKRILLCFQPHQHSRTLELKDEFIEALAASDHTIISEIYGVSGRTEKEERMISSKDLVDGILAKNPTADCVYAENLEEAEKLIREKAEEGDIILIMGAGDIDSIARNLV